MDISTKIKNSLMLVAATISAMGNYPYAKNFAYFVIENESGRWIGAFVFVLSALFSNAILGFYSLYDSLLMIKQTSPITCLLTGFISFIASFSIGFICFFGYSEILPLVLNILLSLIVVLVNAGISFSAVNKLGTGLVTLFLHLRFKKINKIYLMISLITIISAIMASFCTYLASTNGLINILIYWDMNTLHWVKTAYLLSIFVWLPFAALFTYGSYVTVFRIYKAFSDKKITLSWITFITLFITIPSGSAYAQMIIEFFNPSRHMPSLFQQIVSYQQVIIYFLMPIGFIISSLVNGYALTHLVQILKNRKYS